MSDKTNMAKDFAKEKHANQTRKSSNIPYYSHPYAVAKRIQELEGDEDMIVAAYLHDVIEDTPCHYQEISKKFGKIVADLVQELTTNKEEAKQVGKPQYLTEKLNNISEKARIIKLADRENNVSDLHLMNHDFTNRYANETDYIINHISFKPNQKEATLIASIREKIQRYLI